MGHLCPGGPKEAGAGGLLRQRDRSAQGIFIVERKETDVTECHKHAKSFLSGLPLQAHRHPPAGQGLCLQSCSLPKDIQV